MTSAEKKLPSKKSLFEFKSIKTKLTVIIIVMLLVSGTALTGIAALMASNALEEAASGTLHAVSENTATKIVMANDAAKDTVTVFSLDPEILSALLSWNEGTFTPEKQHATSEYLINLQKTLSEIFGDVNVIDNQGTVITSTIASNFGVDFSAKDYFIHQQKESYIASPHIGTGNVPHFTYVRPVYDDSGKQIGLVQICTDIPALSDLIFSMPGMSPEAVNFLVDRDGTILSGVRGDYSVFLTKKFDLSIFPPGKDIVMAPGYYGNMEYIVKEPVPGTDWLIITSERVDEVNRSIMTLVSMMVLSLIVVIVAGLLATAFIANGFTRPIQTLTDNAEQLALGDISVAITHIGTDEIGQLAESFRCMVEKTRKNVDAVQKIALGEVNFEMTIASDKDVEGKAIIQMRENLSATTESLNMLVHQVAEGILSYRSDTDQFQGVYYELIETLNQALDQIIYPVQEAIRLSTAYSGGDYSEQFNPELVVKGDFIAFKAALNQIGINSSDALLKIRHGVENINADAYQSSASIKDIATSVSTLAESSSRVSSLAVRNDSSLEQALTAMNDLADTVSEVAQRTAAVSQLASQSSDLAYDGVKRAELAGKGMEKVMKSAEEIAQAVSEMTSHMDEIGGIVDVISGIAEQTSLLALNAAIEAARAGDAGLGFAVVADEVKSLAQESQTSAEHIVSIISNLQKIATEMATGMEQASVAVQSGSSAVNETVTIFQQMAETTSDVYKNMSEVAAASEEQAASVQEITASMSEVRNMVQDTTKEATDSAAAAEEINASLVQLKNNAAASAQLTEVIAQQVGQFKIE